MSEEEKCATAYELSNNVAFEILLGALTCVSTVAIIVEAYSMKRTTMHMTVHANTRILILAHQVGLILHCLARIHAHIMDLYLFTRSLSNPCDYLSTATRCFFLRVPITLTFFLSVCSVGGIVAERTIATLFSAKYERMGKGVAIVLVTAEVVVSVVLLFCAVYDDNALGSTKTVYCATLNEDNSNRGVAILSVLFALDVASALLLPILLCINEKSRRNEVHANLSHRYQMSENIASIRTLLPLLIFHSTVFAVFIAALLTYFVTQPSSSHMIYAVFLESVQLTPVYALLLPAMLSYTQRRVQKRQIRTLNSAIGFSKKEATDLYFVNLNDLTTPKYTIRRAT
ncbi:unnamed protein product [Toxocara canis]|uniref:G protein-coupled receptor n=1 Tax=Toxocara canis TaxID=6265 RepID=A0A183UDK5_TOXCA|nr:unnamed protein product [Toxocara canis]